MIRRISAALSIGDDILGISAGFGASFSSGVDEHVTDRPKPFPRKVVLVRNITLSCATKREKRVRPVSLLTFSLPRLLDSNFPGNPPGA